MRSNEFEQGYACAVATMVKSHDIGVPAREALEAAGLTSMEKLKGAGVDPHDIKILKPLILEIIHRKERYEKVLR